jgi:hypothetical protein
MIDRPPGAPKSSQVKSIKVRLLRGCWYFCDACVSTCVQTAPDSVSAIKVNLLHPRDFLNSMTGKIVDECMTP